MFGKTLQGMSYGVMYMQYGYITASNNIVFTSTIFVRRARSVGIQTQEFYKLLFSIKHTQKKNI